MTQTSVKTAKDVIDAIANEDREILLTRTSTKTAKDFIKMKKQETPAQPQIIPDAVADVLTRPFKIAASPFPYARKNSVFPRPLKTAAFRFPYAQKNTCFPPGSALFSIPSAQSDNFPRPLKIAATPNRRPSNPVSLGIKSGATPNDSRPPPEIY